MTSAFYKGMEVYDTNGEDVNLDAKAIGKKTVRQVIDWHQATPEIKGENRDVALLTFGVPILALFWMIYEAIKSL